MNDPDAEDAEWLLARELGGDVSHVVASKRAPYDQISAMLSERLAPSAGWKLRVLEAIDAAERSAAPQPAGPAAPAAEPAPPAEREPAAQVVPIRRRWVRRVQLAGGLAAAAALAIVVSGLIGDGGGVTPDQSGQIALGTEVRPGPGVHRAGPMRGHQANLGDTLVVRATATGPAELRVYGGSGEKLLAVCGEGDGCITRDGERRRFVLEVALKLPGEARAVVFAGATIPPTAGSLSQDLEAAAGAGIRTEPSQATRVY